MLSIQKLSAGSGKYYTDLAREDYYLNGGEPPGIWHGKGAAALGLVGQVDKSEFHNLFDGFSPDGRVALAQNAGQTEGYHKRSPGFDLTFSAPKSFSTFLSQSSHEVQAVGRAIQMRAVKAGISCAEEVAGFSRRGKGGKVWDRAGFITAIFEHGTSRAGEPQLHSHAVVMMTGVRPDGTTGAIISCGLYDYMKAVGTLYRCELAALAQQELGLKVERVKDWFEVSGVSQKLQEVFSTRRREILEFCKTHGFEGAKAAEYAALETRQVKGHVARDLLQARWREIGREIGWGEREATALLNQVVVESDLSQETDRIIRAVTDEIGNAKQFVSRPEVIETVARHAQASGLNARQVLEIVAGLSQSQQLRAQGTVKHQEVFTTAGAVKDQEEILALVSGSKIAKSSATAKPEPDQRIAPSQNEKQKIGHEGAAQDIHPQVLDLTGGPGIVHVVTGLSDGERQQTIQQAKEWWRAAGFDVHELNGRRFPKIIWESATVGASFQAVEKTLFPHAPAWSAAADWKLPHFTIALEKQPRFGPAKSLIENRFFEFGSRAKHPFADAVKFNPLRKLKIPTLVLRINDDPFGLKKGVVIILDEASKVAASKIKELVKVALATGARLILTDKPEAVPSGGLFSQLDPTRKRKPISFGISKTQPKTYESIIDDWKQKGVRTPGQNVMLTMSPGAAQGLNLLAQRERLQAGYLGWDSVWAEGLQIHRKDRVRFSEVSIEHGVKLGELGTVTRAGHGKLHIFLDSGRRVVVSLESYHGIKLGYALPHFETAQLTAKRRFVLFEGTHSEIELAQIQRHGLAGKVQVYGQTEIVEQAFAAQSANSREKIKSRFKASSQKAETQNEYHSH